MIDIKLHIYPIVSILTTSAFEMGFALYSFCYRVYFYFCLPFCVYDRSSMLQSSSKENSDTELNINNVEHDRRPRDEAFVHPYSATATIESFAQNLRSCENPIFEIFLRYGPIMSDEWTARLLRASAFEATTKTPRVVARVFAMIRDEILVLIKRSIDVMHDMVLVESGASQLADMKKTGNAETQLFRESVHEFFRLLGDINAQSVLMECKLGEYRSLFQGLSAVETPVNLTESTEFRECYDCFLLSQSKLIELNNRVFAVKSTCTEYGLAEGVNMANVLPPHTSIPVDASRDQLSAEEREDEKKIDADDDFQAPYTNFNTDNEILTVLKEKSKLLEDAKEEIEDLETELFAAEQAKDRTPGALLFFAGLYDPVAVGSMGALLDAVKSFKGVADCKEHLNFESLRQRLLACLSTVPALERFLHKFHKMHGKWTEGRFRIFSTRNQAGGDGDSAHTCPLCAYDGRAGSLTNTESPTSKVPQPHSRSEIDPDLTISAKMVCSPIVQRSPNPRKGRNSPFGSPVSKKIPPASSQPLAGTMTPPLRLGSAGVNLMGIGSDLSGREDRKKQLMDKVRNKIW